AWMYWMRLSLCGASGAAPSTTGRSRTWQTSTSGPRARRAPRRLRAGCGRAPSTARQERRRRAARRPRQAASSCRQTRRTGTSRSSRRCLAHI
ncbi:hypothetical protein EC988_008802, partial [Linderina pennispora]